MIYNETLTTNYGAIPETFSGTPPRPYVPAVNSEDYKLGHIKRTFAKKVNEDKIIEIRYSDSTTINTALYKIVILNWKVAGPKNNTTKNGVISGAGVMEQNKFEIDRVMKEDEVDLSRQLSNLLEFWRGY